MYMHRHEENILIQRYQWKDAPCSWIESSVEMINQFFPLSLISSAHSQLKSSQVILRI